MGARSHSGGRDAPKGVPVEKDPQGQGAVIDALLAAGLVVLRRDDYERMVERIEDLEDRARILASEARGGPSPDALPEEFLDRIIAGEHPVRVWREYRGLTLLKLAERSDVPVGYLSEIENRKKPGSVKAYKAIADALEVDLDELLADEPDEVQAAPSKQTTPR